MTTTESHTDKTNNSSNDTTRIVDTYLAGYCEPDAARRALLVAEAWSTNGELFDPPFEAAGHGGIAALTDVVLAHFPAHTFRRTTGVDAHHTFARYGWELVAADGTVAVAGTDVVEFAADGRLARVVGFFGEPA